MLKVFKALDWAVFLSLLSLAIALFTLFYNVRPARIEPVMNAVYVSSQSGMHISVPLSIVNSGARPETVVGAKLVESAGNAQVLWGAIFAADASHGISAVTGDISPANAMLWMPFIVPGNGEVQEIVIFEPVPGSRAPLAASGRAVFYHVVLLLAKDAEASTTGQVIWPTDTDRVLARKSGGVGSATTAVDNWLRL